MHKLTYPVTYLTKKLQSTQSINCFIQMFFQILHASWIRKWHLFLIYSWSDPNSNFNRSIGWLVGWLVFNGTLSTNRLYHVSNTLNRKSQRFFGLGFCADNNLATIRHSQGRPASQSFGKYRQLNQKNQETEHIQTQTKTQKVALINSNTFQNYVKRVRKESTWFSCLLQHPARKKSESILTSQEPTGAQQQLTEENNGNHS